MEDNDPRMVIPTRDPDMVLAFRSIKWRVTAGWVVVAIIAFRYLARPIFDIYLIGSGQDPLPPLLPLDLADAAAIIGLPIGGSFADRMNND